MDYTKENIVGEYASLDNFIREWRKDPKKERIRDMLLERGIDLEKMKTDQNMSDVDDFDFICHVAYDKKPLTRWERANNVKKRDFLSKYSETAKEIIETLLDQYMNLGVYEIEKTEYIPGCGTVRVGCGVKEGLIAEVSITGDFFGARDVSELCAALPGVRAEREEVTRRLVELSPGEFIAGIAAEQLAGLLVP